MTLRRQLLLVCLLTLVLPWAGCQFIRETESALREGQQQMLAGTAQAIADALAQFQGEFPHRPGDMVQTSAVYGHPLATPPLVDGYFVDWAMGEDSLVPLRGDDTTARYATGVYRGYVYIYVDVADVIVHYAQSDDATHHNSDRVELVTDDGQGTAVTFTFAPEAPGNLVALRRAGGESAVESRISAHWQDTANGYQLEARIPRPLLGEFVGLIVTDVVDPLQPATRTATFDGQSPGVLVSASPILESVAAGYVQPGLRLIVTDTAGWRLAEAGNLTLQAAANSATSGWMRMVYDALLESGADAALAEPDPTGREQQHYTRLALQGDVATSWFRSQRSGRAVVAVAQPVWAGNVQAGVVVLQQGTDAILSLTNRALMRLMNITIIATLVVAAALLGYASWLSFRIRRLSSAALQALDGDRVHADLPSTGAADEIGDLSRSFSSVLKQLGEYNEYLRTLASKLSHEMRTPLTIVMSSLENLEHESLSEESAQYTARARSGALRLQKILTAMSEASRVEELIENAEPERFDINAVLDATASAYADAWQDRRISFTGAGSEVLVDGSPELIVQMLDKLVDNAVDFSAPGDAIAIRLTTADQIAVLSVTNPGPPLPARMRSQLFDSMVSVRGEESDRHLGLGLYIARLIAVGHGGTIHAVDVEGGVTFEVRLPANHSRIQDIP
ncbi:MAG: ATP-binding protein [Woeseia sp.]